MSDSTRTRILGEARRQLVERGYDGFTVAGVRDALGLSSGSMFHAFGSRAELAAAVYVDGMAAYQAVATAALAEPDPPGAAVGRLIRAHAGWVEEHPELSRLLFATVPDDVRVHVVDPLTRINDEFFAALDAFYDALREAGAVGDLDRWATHALCVGPTQEYCRHWVRGNAATPPGALSDTFADAARASLAATVAAPSPP